MTIDLATAQKRAIEAIGGGAVEVELVDSLPAPAYNFDAVGWLLFVVHRRTDFRVGGNEFVGVHAETGEVRNLGSIGE